MQTQVAAHRQATQRGLGKSPKANRFRDMDNKTTAEPTPATERSELNGAPATVDDLRAIALMNYGHFSSMQVEDGGVRGLDLHLARLSVATRELFGTRLDTAAVRSWMRHLVAGERGALSLRIQVFSRALQRDRMTEPAAPDVLITRGPARASSLAPLRLKSLRHQRTAPHLKHVGTFELFHHRRLAQAQGFDDALFVGDDGTISEGSIWNIGFFDGRAVVWPEAPQLLGVSMQLLQSGLTKRGVPSVTRRVTLSDVGTYRSAFFTNSGCAVRPIASIDEMALAVDPERTALLTACYESNPPQPI